MPLGEQHNLVLCQTVKGLHLAIGWGHECHEPARYPAEEACHGRQAQAAPCAFAAFLQLLEAREVKFHTVRVLQRAQDPFRAELIQVRGRLHQVWGYLQARFLSAWAQRAPDLAKHFPLWRDTRNLQLGEEPGKLRSIFPLVSRAWRAKFGLNTCLWQQHSLAAPSALERGLL